MTTLQHALKYLKAGLSVIPVKPRSKEPLIEWKEYQQRLPTADELGKWFQSKDLNLGIVTGSVSNLCVIDADGPIGLQSLKRLTLHSNVVAISGKGKHLYYKWTPGIKNSASKIAEGIDVRGEGGFVLAPPSIHPNGKRYRWCGLVSMPSARLPGFPTDLVNVGTVSETKFVRADSWISDALEEMKHGHVHNTLISILGRFRRHNFSIADTVKLLRPYAFNEDGTPFDELEDKVNELWGRYEPANRQIPLIRFAGNEADYSEYTRITSESNPSRVFRAGFTTLDQFCEGGLRSERIFTIAARTGENKTNTALAISKSLCEANKKVLYFSTEFSFKKIWERYINQLKDPKRFREHAFYVCDAFSPNIEQVEEVIKEVMPDVFVFDHINHLGEERETISSFMQGCTLLQKKYNAQGIILAQLNRYADFVQDGKRIEPRLSMIKGADAIGQMSSRVLLLSVTKVTPEMDEIEAIMDKNDAGSKGKFFLGLYKSPYYIKELDGGHNG